MDASLYDSQFNCKVRKENLLSTQWNDTTDLLCTHHLPEIQVMNLL